MRYSEARGTLIYEKKLKSKISCQTPFKAARKTNAKGGGVTEGGGFSGLNDKLDTNCQSYLTIPHTSQSLQNKILDRMSKSGDTVIYVFVKRPYTAEKEKILGSHRIQVKPKCGTTFSYSMWL